MNISDLTTQDGFSAFLHAYHQRLHDERSFPPLGPQKALHTASPIFGYKDWNAMAASAGWMTAEREPQKETLALLIEYRSSYEPGEEDKGFIEETDLKLCDESSARTYLSHLVGLRRPLNLVGKNGPEVAYTGDETKDFSLEKWVEFAEFALEATIKIKRSGAEHRPAESEAPEASVISVVVDYLGQHQSPHNEEHTLTICDPSSFRRFIHDLIIEDFGAISTVVDILRLDMDEQHHALHDTRLYNCLINYMTPPNHSAVAERITGSLYDDRISIRDLIAFFEAAACVNVTVSGFDVEGDDRFRREREIDSVVRHVQEMQQKHGFKNDTDSVREAVDESANLLSIQLTEDQIIRACNWLI